MPKKVRDILSSKLSIFQANRHRRDDLESLISEFQRVCQNLIDIIWGLDHIPSLLPLEITSQIQDSWLSARMLQCCGKQASGIARSVRNKLKKAEKHREWLLTQHRSVKKVTAQIEKLKVAKPEISTIQPQLSSQCFSIDRDNKTSFETWVTIHSTGREKILLPLKGSKHLDSLLELEGNILNSIRVSRNFVHLCLEMPEVPQRASGGVLGVDVGITEMFHCSDGQVEMEDIHGWTLSKVMEKLTRRKYGSKGFEKAQAHRNSFINWSVKRLNLDGVLQVNIENLKDVRRGKICSRKQKRWTYGSIIRGLERTCARAGVRTVRLDPAFTSRRCNVCGWTHRENRRGKLFRCDKCGLTTDADLNASLNLVLALPKILGWQWGQHRKGNGFFWCPTGQELMVPDVQ
jgi:transposase